ncbi:chloride channel protein [Granulicella sp. dw_53]|uniref:chloride channel protein n=1 Tax=Granulicella sp. dw_53 TaxID=2719792 RepID=UPI001BD3CA45|nr:chloride channel protein [Granulicella sp. dw_53]
MTATSTRPSSEPTLIGAQNLRRIFIVSSWAAALGLVSGLACVAVRLTFRALQWILVHHGGTLPEAAASLSPQRRLLTPLIGGALATAVLWAAERWCKEGCLEGYVEAVRFRRGHIPFASTLWRTASSVFSVASGAAIGREGSMIQFAAAATSWVGERSSLRTIPLSRQVSYGVAAAVAAAYQAPLAGVFFALEIVIGEWAWIEILPLLIASLTGAWASRMILGGGPLFPVLGTLTLSKQILWALPFAIALGLAGPAYQLLLRSLRSTSRWPLALIWSGLAVGALSLLQPAVWGNGDFALLQTLQGSPSLSAIALILALRLVATTFCVGTGTVGGVFTPTLFAGAAIGLSAGHLLHADQPVLLAVIGLSAFLAAVTHAPFMAGLMAAELTGQWHLLPLLLILNILSWYVAKSLSPRSLYAIASDLPTYDVSTSDEDTSPSPGLLPATPKSF